jgi:uncharacterized protein (UPF0332 family)
MTEPEISLISYRMDRSREALSAAKLLYEEGHHNDAVNRLYYSCFYALIALLATEGIHPKKHSEARAHLNKKWIKTGKLSRETGQLYNTLYDRREKGDYGDYFRFKGGDVRDWLESVERALEEIFQVIGERLAEN